MNPSQLKPDADNDVNSLEGSDTIIESDGPESSPKDTLTVKPAPGETSGSAKPPKIPFFKRLWRHFNIYLLLFLLLLLIGGIVVLVLFLQFRADQPKTEDVTGAQTLSGAALKQLANGDTTIGNSKQILNVESNAVFSGALLVRSNLEVAGTIKVGGDIALPGLTVSGNSRFGQVSADTLSIGGATNIQGPLTAQRGLTVGGNSTFNGSITANQISTNSLQLNGDLTLTRHITAGGPIPALSRGNALGGGGTASVSGSDISGTVTINTGTSPPAGCFATITFVRAYSSTPHVVVTPVGAGAANIGFYINRSTNSFSICGVTPAGGGQSFGFDYMVLS